MSMHPQLQQAYDAEMMVAATQYRAGDLDQAFSHLERAHILGQSFPIAHAQAHWWMLKVGLKRRDLIEVCGQIPRIIGALLFSNIWVPVGNTGGARVPPFRSMPISEDLRSLLEKYGPGSKA
ncbi:MAG: DUF3703 domain-containing protein [Nitrospira sp.]|nr:DUF3703 domain-containing protein [Nitrospira sp.]